MAVATIPSLRIEWKEMAAAGNICRHEYEDVADRRVWTTVRVALSPLRAVVEGEIPRKESSPLDDLAGDPRNR